MGVLMYRIEVEDGKYKLKGYMRNDFYWMDDVDFEIPEKEIHKLIKLLRPVMKWNEEYQPDDEIFDGYGWDIDFQYKDICIKTGGYEEFPSDYCKVRKRLQFFIEKLGKKYNKKYQKDGRKARIKL